MTSLNFVVQTGILFFSFALTAVDMSTIYFEVSWMKKFLVWKGFRGCKRWLKIFQFFVSWLGHQWPFSNLHEKCSFILFSSLIPQWNFRRNLKVLFLSHRTRSQMHIFGFEYKKPWGLQCAMLFAIEKYFQYHSWKIYSFLPCAGFEILW